MLPHCQLIPAVLILVVHILGDFFSENDKNENIDSTGTVLILC